MHYSTFGPLITQTMHYSTFGTLITQTMHYSTFGTLITQTMQQWRYVEPDRMTSKKTWLDGIMEDVDSFGLFWENAPKFGTGKEVGATTNQDHLENGRYNDVCVIINVFCTHLSTNCVYGTYTYCHVIDEIFTYLSFYLRFIFSRWCVAAVSCSCVMWCRRLCMWSSTMQQ